MRRYNNLAEEALGSAKTQPMRRYFTRRERKAIARVYAHHCAECGALTNDGHADHITPHSKGGPTTLGNAQWLCAPCNLKKGANVSAAAALFSINKPTLDPSTLWDWQARCLDKQLAAINAGQNSFFVAAGVGSGKTVQALALYMAGNFDLVIAVTPKGGIRGSWQADAAMLGLDLQPILSSSLFDPERQERTMPNGWTLTAGMLPSVMNEIKMLCSKLRVLCVVDEAHHCTETGTWGDNVQEAFADAAFMNYLSGTPFRHDNKRILGLHYERAGHRGQATPQFIYSGAEALTDQRVAAIAIRHVGGSVTHIESNGARIPFNYSDGDYSEQFGTPQQKLMQRRLRLSAQQSIDWQKGAVDNARNTLANMGSDWAGLIICREVWQAKALSAYLNDKGEKAMCIVGDTDTTTAVDDFNADPSWRWAVAITKVSEGISIPRLRVGVYLSPVASRNYFEQVMGRLQRLVKGVPHGKQSGVFFIPADPRLMQFAREANDMLLHSVPWLSDDKSPLPDGWTEEDRQEIKRNLLDPPMETAGDYDVEGTAEMAGGHHDGEDFTEAEWLLISGVLLGFGINPMTASRADKDFSDFIHILVGE